jgi:hypothetical protein
VESRLKVPYFIIALRADRRFLPTTGRLRDGHIIISQ